MEHQLTNQTNPLPGSSSNQCHITQEVTGSSPVPPSEGITLRLSISYTLSILTAQTLYSGILATGSRAGLVRRLAGLSAKWKVINTTPTGDASVTFALVTTSPRRETTFTMSPSLMPREEASSGFTSTNPSPRNMLSPLTFLVIVPV